MHTLSKLCDAADWFRPEIHEIITRSLRETPRFHRKQWESAMIIHALRRLGKLRHDARGLSMGGGRELVLYAVAQEVQQLVVTDLYSPDTTWDCAKTDDPDSFIRAGKPFPVDDARLKALRMDMRSLDFPDGSFDFAYSSCAVEHIGTRADFARHFAEVARVLSDDGVYVFTTEVSCDDVTIRDDHNYIFSLQELFELIERSGLAPEPAFDARITPHRINFPVAANLRNLAYTSPELPTDRFLRDAPHIHLLRGKHPFTCGLFVLRRIPGTCRPVRPVVTGLEESRRFLHEGVETYRSLLHHAAVSLDPFSWLPEGTSRYFADHAAFFNAARPREGGADTVFHSDYFWLGSVPRVVDVCLDIPDPGSGPPPEIEVRIHRYATLASQHVTCAAASMLTADRPGLFTVRLALPADEDDNYAVLAKMHAGFCLCRSITIRSYPAHQAPPAPPVVAPRHHRTDIMRSLRSLWTR